MSNLGCTVDTCEYNAEEMCCKKEIKIAGEEANSAKGTCCASFAEKDEESKKDDTGKRGCGPDCDCGEPEPKTEIECEAENCQYNDHHHCEAGHVEVDGGHAVISNETECSTFKAAK